MSATPPPAAAASPPSRAARPRLDARARRQVAALTALAVATFVGVRLLPVGSALNHMDFRVAGPNVIPFCDPANPAFIPVVEVRSPVEMRAATAAPARAGEATALTVRLVTASGKPIEARDLLESHTRRLHLLVVDPSRRDYQHLHPEPAAADPAAWRAEFTPRFGGAYRVFADFVPAATGRGLYAFADLDVAGAPAAADELPATGFVELDGFRFSLELRPVVVRAGRRAELTLALAAREPGGAVPLEPVMGAFAHVVAFDAARSGFAHLHPLAADPLAPPDARAPRLDFAVEVPRAGRYVLWAQVKLAGRERFVPFVLPVEP